MAKQHPRGGARDKGPPYPVSDSFGWVFTDTAVNAIVFCGLAMQWMRPTILSYLAEASPQKAFSTFETFYPHYLSEHKDETSRMLHFVGTVLIILYSVSDPRLMLSSGISALVGFGVADLTRSLDTGYVEFAIILSVYFFVSKRMMGDDFKNAFVLPVCGYAFAWAGHFFFELNQPATFTYPTYSLVGDFNMAFDTLKSFF